MVVTVENLHPPSAGWRLPESPCFWLLGPEAGGGGSSDTMAVRTLFLDYSDKSTCFFNLIDQLMRIKIKTKTLWIRVMQRRSECFTVLKMSWLDRWGMKTKRVVVVFLPPDCGIPSTPGGSGRSRPRCTSPLGPTTDLWRTGRTEAAAPRTPFSALLSSVTGRGEGQNSRGMRKRECWMYRFVFDFFVLKFVLFLTYFILAWVLCPQLFPVKCMIK